MRARLQDWLRRITLRMKPQERRRTPRRQFEGTIEISTESGQKLRGTARDVSATGMGAIVYGTLYEGDSVRVRYYHPRPDGATPSVIRQAIVRTRYGHRYGFEFTNGLELAAELAATS